MEHLPEAGAIPATSDIELTKKGEEYCRLAEACGVSFITITTDDPKSIGAAIDRLIGMLDAMDPDPDLEDGADNEPTMGWAGNGDTGSKHPDADECEDVSEDEGAITGDDEYDLGWQLDGSQEHLSMWGDYEADLGTTEEVDQVRRLEQAPGWHGGDAEPSLGWAESHGRGVTGEQNCLDDREEEDERELEYDGGVEDLPFDHEGCCDIHGGGSVSQAQDLWRERYVRDRAHSAI